MSVPGDRPDEEPSGFVGWLQWLATTDHEGVAYARELLVSVGAVVLVGLILFSVSGIWPPMVAVESGSMEPNMMTGDLVFVMEEHRFAAGEAYEDTGVVTNAIGANSEYVKFNNYGDVIVFQPNGDAGTTPIIHRAMFHVNESENWYDKANPDYIQGAQNCEQLAHCPAPNDGFVTKGDANSIYDQAGNQNPVHPSWVIGTAEFRIPILGNIRLWVSETFSLFSGMVIFGRPRLFA
ncbi:S26 family signal peptidase [Haladaptatus sp. DJG-WS-42]|uniref:S26 family signal peptidase n=1 Tax=Haladaptatus sp. DJG-WS-42 TaxID=3120516 RepID=UPI0030CB81C3